MDRHSSSAAAAYEEHYGPEDGLGTSDVDDDFAPPIPTGEGEIRGSELIVLPQGCSRGDAIRTLSKDIPQNQFGLPEFFIRSDMLPNFSAGTPVSQQDVDSASVGLFYHEGYPTTEDGRAFWNQLSHEPMDAHILFQKYINQAEEQGIRQLELLAVAEDVELERLRQYYLEFYWGPRSRAHDLFIVAAEMKKRQFRTRKMENDHYAKAGELLAGLSKKFDEEDWWVELSAKEAIEMLDVLVKVQRLSVGLTGMNASSLPKNPLPDSASPAQLLEHLTRGANMTQRDSDGFQNRLMEFLANPEEGMLVQDAIIRLSRPAGAPSGSDAYQED
jgi:hypothetical protein